MGIVIFGGSFNPIHTGHLRLAIETLEMLGDLATRLDFVPCASPPHKDPEGLLPFGLRAAMIRACLAGTSNMRCEDMESKRPGPSYTYDTLLEYREKFPGVQLFFLIGSEEFLLLAEWSRGLGLPGLCNLVVVPRGEFNIADFGTATSGFWPGSANGECGSAHFPCRRTPAGGKVIYLPVPYLKVSASHIRMLWLAGRNIKYLVPDPVLGIMEREKQALLAYWRENNGCSM